MGAFLLAVVPRQNIGFQLEQWKATSSLRFDNQTCNCFCYFPSEAALVQLRSWLGQGPFVGNFTTKDAVPKQSAFGTEFEDSIPLLLFTNRTVFSGKNELETNYLRRMHILLMKNLDQCLPHGHQFPHLTCQVA